MVAFVVEFTEFYCVLFLFTNFIRYLHVLNFFLHTHYIVHTQEKLYIHTQKNMVAFLVEFTEFYCVVFLFANCIVFYFYLLIVLCFIFIC